MVLPGGFQVNTGSIFLSSRVGPLTHVEHGPPSWKQTYASAPSTESGEVPKKTSPGAYIIHSRKLTWNLKMNPWKRRFLLKTIIFRFHVSFRGGIILTNYCSFHQKYLCNLCNLLYKPTAVPRVLSPPSLIAALHRVAEHPRVWNCRCSACCFWSHEIAIHRSQSRDQGPTKNTRRVGVGCSRKLTEENTPSTLMMFILFTSFFKIWKKNQSPQHKLKFRDFDMIRHPSVGNWRGGLDHFLEHPLIFFFQQDLPSNSNSITPWVAVAEKTNWGVSSWRTNLAMHHIWISIYPTWTRR